MAKKKLRAGVIGLGVGTSHCRNYIQHEGAELVAVADPNGERMQERVKELGVDLATYTDPMKMLKEEKLDVVSVATPNKFHCPLTLAAFKAGCHVLCEKPIAMNAKEGKRMLAAAKKAKKRLMINFSYRFTEQAWALHKQVEDGILGNVYFGRTVWHRRRGMPGFGGWFGQKALSGGGPLIDLGVHRIDLALWLMGYPKPTYMIAGAYDHIASAKAKAAKKKFDVEDLAAGCIRFDNGATLIVEASWAANIAESELMETRLMGTEAGLVQRNVGGGYQFEAELYLEKNGCPFDMKLHPPVPGNPGSAMGHFVDAIQSNKPHIATGEEAVIVQEILDGLYKSAKTGKPVKAER